MEMVLGLSIEEKGETRVPGSIIKYDDRRIKER
jgi:hypothetical protein